MLPPEFTVHLRGPEGGPLPIDFETLAERLQRMPRLFFEWDGSWVWTGESASIDGRNAQHWQIDVMVYDAAGAVQYIDLKGTCPLRAWQELIAACQSSTSPVELANLEVASEKFTSLTVSWVARQELWELSRFQETLWSDAE